MALLELLGNLLDLFVGLMELISWLMERFTAKSTPAKRWPPDFGRPG
jgi:hypothetical protein